MDRTNIMENIFYPIETLHLVKRKWQKGCNVIWNCRPNHNWIWFLFQYERVSKTCMTNAQSRYNGLLSSWFSKSWSSFSQDGLTCQTTCTDKHILIESRAFAVIRKQFFKVNSLTDLFENAKIDDVLSFLYEKNMTN